MVYRGFTVKRISKSQKPNKSIKALSYLGLTFLIFLVVTSSRKRYFPFNLCDWFPASFCCWCLTVLIVNEKGLSPNRSSRRTCSLKISQKFIKKETLAGVFSCEFCKNVTNTSFTEYLWTNSVQILFIILG